MNILFLHLCDAHIKETTKADDINVNALVRSLTQMGHFDEIFLFFSGDITQSGELNEYKAAKAILGNIIKQIKDKYCFQKRVHTFIIPGNHDLKHGTNILKREAIVESYKVETHEDLFSNELLKLNNFFEFARYNKCFQNSDVIDIFQFDAGDGFNIRINLINTAPFSLKGGTNADKGLHYLPTSALDRLNNVSNEKYTISILHHSPEWFKDSIKNTLYESLHKHSDLVFIGHDHMSKMEKKIVDSQYAVDYLAGIPLHGVSEEKGYTAFILDTKNSTIEGKLFSKNGSIYKPTTVLDKHVIKFREKKAFVFNDEFKNYLIKDEGERVGQNFYDYFVFPELEETKFDEELKKKELFDESDFLRFCDGKKRIIIEGGLNSGKSTLAKYICQFFYEKDYVPILLDRNSFSPKNIEKVLNAAFDSQFIDDADFDEFLQLEQKQRVLIIDDFDKINKEKVNVFLEQYGELFIHVIMFSNPSWDFNVREKAIEAIEEKKTFYLKISPFYFKKRELLIEKICNKTAEHTPMDVVKITAEINSLITEQIKYFQLNPDFIHQYVDYYLTFSHIKSPTDSNVFNKVFSANITFRLSKAAGEENVDEMMIALDYVAYFIHFNKRYVISVEEFCEVINEYNKKYDNNLKPKVVLTAAKKANILIEEAEGFGIEFCDESLLSYFVATNLNRLLNEGSGKPELEYVLKNICFDPNGDIILFLSYITSNILILNPILIYLKNHMEDWEELSIDDNNIEFLSSYKNISKPELPDNVDKEKHKDNKDKIEKEVIQKKNSNAGKLYTYDESKANTFSNRVTKGIKYLELLAKILPSFRHMLKGEQKKEIVECLYKYPNRLLYFMLKDIDDEITEIVNDILAGEPKTKEGLLISEGMIKTAIKNLSISYILSIYDFVAEIASNAKTIYDLNKIDYWDYNNNSNYRLQNLLMEESASNTDAFFDKAEAIYHDSEKDVIKQMTTLIVRKYFLCHEVQLVGKAQHVIDLFFGKKKRNEMQLIQAKKRFEKK